jgi:hypothetical protein
VGQLEAGRDALTPARRLAYLILLAVAVLTLSVLVLVRHRSGDDEMLAAIGLLGGLAIAVVALPVNGGK